MLQKSGLGKDFRKKLLRISRLPMQTERPFIRQRSFVQTFLTPSAAYLSQGQWAPGKTHLASAVTNDLIGRLYTVICRNITDIISLIKSTYGQKTELEEWEIVDILTTEVDLLVIDDLGKERASENTNTLLYQIINRLYNDERPIVVTTNFTSVTLAENSENVASL